MKIISSGKWGIDSNIILYALNSSSVHHSAAKEFFTHVLQRKDISLVVAQQNIIEVERVLINVYKQKVDKVVQTLQQFVDGFQCNVICPLPTTITRYHKIVSYQKKLDIFDAFLAATYLDNEVNTFFTLHSKDFKHIDDFKVYNPFEVFSMI